MCVQMEVITTSNAGSGENLGGNNCLLQLINCVSEPRHKLCFSPGISNKLKTHGSVFKRAFRLKHHFRPQSSLEVVKTRRVPLSVLSVGSKGGIRWHRTMETEGGSGRGGRDHRQGRHLRLWPDTVGDDDPGDASSRDAGG